MNKILITLLISITLIGVTYSTGGVSSRNYTHKDKAINQEFDNVYYQLNHPSPTFYDRGDPVGAYDFIETDLKINSAWQAMDLSSIVPAGAKAVCLMVRMIDNLPGKAIFFRKYGNVGVRNYSILFTQVANITVAADMIVACDQNRIIEYYAETGIDIFYITVKGWWK